MFFTDAGLSAFVPSKPVPKGGNGTSRDPVHPEKTETGNGVPRGGPRIGACRGGTIPDPCPENPGMGEEMLRYFEELEGQVRHAYGIANTARALGIDPREEVEIPLAQDLAARVENLVGPPGIAVRIRQLLAEIGNREEVSIILARELAREHGGTPEESIDQAVRTCLAVLTEGVLVAPLEGISKVKLKQNADGTGYAAIYFSGPIRSAGGTGQAMSVLIADVARQELGIGNYQATDREVERLKEEIPLYRRLQHLQYTPEPAEIEMIVRNCPISIDGEATEDEEISGNRDLDAFDTNRVRGGACLVITEGISLKAPKMLKHVERLGISGWDFLRDLVKGKGKGEEGVKPNFKYMKDIIAGRPVFSYPSREGGFRLRYGRARTAGTAALAVHPAALTVTGGFLAIGTQIKIERPGKAGAITTCDSIEGPIVTLRGGSTIRLDSRARAEEVKDQITRVVDLGEILVPFGEFAENNHPLMPGAFCPEWWEAEVRDRGVDPNGGHPTEGNPDGGISCGVDPEGGLPAGGDSGATDPFGTARKAFAFMEEHGVPLHPAYTLFWHDLTVEETRELRDFVMIHGQFTPGGGPEPGGGGGAVMGTDGAGVGPRDTGQDRARPKDTGQDRARPKDTGQDRARPKDTGQDSPDSGSRPGVDPSSPEPRPGNRHHGDRLTIKNDPFMKRRLEDLGALHVIEEGRILLNRYAYPLLRGLGLDEHLALVGNPDTDNIMEWVSLNSGGMVKPRSPTRIGTRMGRPEKAKERTMKPPLHALFPVGEAGTNQRLVNTAASTGAVQVEVGVRYCPGCERDTHRFRCLCGIRTLDRQSIASMPVTIRDDLDHARRLLSLNLLPQVKGVKGMMSKHKFPEHLEKGVLRALREVYVYKDGTMRVDMTDLPLTHFRPYEIGTPVERLRELGYLRDIAGCELEHDHQILELKVQDVIPALSVAEYLIRGTGFVDDELRYIYGMEPYYRVRTIPDLVGTLVIGLAPHTSAGVLGRIIGFTRASACYAHPFFHTAKRRNCDGDEDALMLLMDGLLNFSREYLPDRLGGQMDAPLVLSLRINPSEIDKEAHNLDVSTRYPLEFYRATERGTSTKEVEGIMDTVGGRIGTPGQYQGFGFTHDTSDINDGPLISAYKSMGSMGEKMDAEFRTVGKLRGVDVGDMARRVIESHFLPDIIGNMNSFSKQSFRCVSCNTIYRRIPMKGVCTHRTVGGEECSGKLLLTVYENSVKKYLTSTLDLAEQYQVPLYTVQRIQLMQKAVQSLFDSDRYRKATLDEFV